MLIDNGELTIDWITINYLAVTPSLPKGSLSHFDKLSVTYFFENNS